MARRWLTRWLAALLLAFALAAAAEVYQREADFLREVFAGAVPDPAVLWLTGERRQRVTALLGHPYARLRLRYWRRGPRTAWILEETGKEQPITAGFVVEDGRIRLARVLAFRERRGWEIRRPAFTRQFQGAALRDGRLDRPIDGITGATLSVRAMRRMARLALWLERTTRAERP